MRLIDADELLTDNTWEWFDEWGNCTTAGKAIVKSIYYRGKWHDGDGETVKRYIQRFIRYIGGEKHDYTYSNAGRIRKTD